MLTLHSTLRAVALTACLALVPAVAQTAPDRPDLSPVDVDLIRPHIEEGRWLWLGDSYSVPTRSRVPLATLVTWPLGRVGAVFVGTQSQLARLVPGGLEPKVIFADTGFELAAGTPTASRLGLPLYRLREWSLPAGETVLGEVSLGFSNLLDGYAARDGSPFDGETTARPVLYSRPEGPNEGAIHYTSDPSSDLPPVPTGFSVGQGSPTVLTGDRRVPLLATLSTPGYVHLAGTLVSGDPGHYAQFLADGSWSYWGFGSDADPAPPDSVKRFRTDDLAGFLAATTLDPDQPSVVVIHLAHERRAEAYIRQALERALAQTRRAFDLAGLDEPVFLMVHPQAIDTAVIDTPEENERGGLVMRDIALADPRVAFVSLYDATDGIVFDGRTEARDWLAASRFDPLCFGSRCDGPLPPVRLVEDYGGNLLDEARLHTNEGGALFFSAVLGEILTGQPVSAEPEPGPPVPLLSPNPARRGARVTGALAGAPILDALGRHLGRVGADGTFDAPTAAGVYLVGRARLVVQ